MDKGIDMEKDVVSSEESQNKKIQIQEEVKTKNIEPQNMEEHTLSDNKKINRNLKIIFISIIVIAILWIFVLNPFITFKINEISFKKSAEEYFNMYTEELPTGERIAEVSLQKLYSKGYVTKDFLVSYNLINKETCSVEDSWVKVKKVGNKYQYYTYLQCGMIRSNVDHKGPKITLNKDKELTVSIGEEYQDAGIKNISDNTDGKIEVSKAITKGEVDTSKIGTYKITYTVADSLNNKTTETRVVKVVQKLNSTVKKQTDGLGYYTGNPTNNYMYFSGMLFRIVDIDGDNVRIVADKDISNVNHDGIEKWLDYYYEHIGEESKKLVIKNKYCNMSLKETDLNTTECSSYTKDIYAYIPSIIDVNKSMTDGETFMKPATISWLADAKDKNESYITRDVFFYEDAGKDYLPFNNKYNFGVRPILTIKGDTLITKGDGTYTSPFEVGDFKQGKPDDKVNTRQSGEYISLNGSLFRIQDVLSDGTTKVIAEFTLHNIDEYLNVKYMGEETTYNTKKKENIGYKINNQSSEYVDTTYFVNHEIEVPVYKKNAKYGNEKQVEIYKAKISSPNMYEMFSAASLSAGEKSYWYINSSQDKTLKYGVADIGSAYYGTLSQYISLGVRPVGYLNKNCYIVNGAGTKDNPYVIEK